MSEVFRNERRPYRQVRRAAAAATTRGRLVDAAASILRERPAEHTSLEQVAARAQSTVPTILRHFQTKDALVAVAIGTALERVRAQRPRVRAGDHAAAARALALEHEEHARLLQAAETALPAARRELEAAGRLHRDWLARTFAPALSPLPPVVHRRRLAQLVAVSGPGPWRSLRDTEQLAPRQAEAALAELLRALAP